MGDKYTSTTSKKTNTEIVVLIEKKLTFFQDVIQKTILHVQKNKLLDVIGVSDVTNCINVLTELSKQIKGVTDVSIYSNTDSIINILQTVNNELSSLLKLFGTESFEDLLWICFGNNSINTYTTSDMDRDKFELLKKYFHPTSYKVLGNKKENDKQKVDETQLNEKSKNLDSIDIGIKVKSFHLKIYGIQLIVHNPQHNKSIIITGTVDNILIDLLNNRFINLKNKSINDNIPQSSEFQGDVFKRFLHSLILKDYLIHEPHEIYLKYAGYLSNLNTLGQKTITNIVKDFIASELFLKRNIIIQLLIKSERYDNQYLAYLLYDLLSNDSNGNIDTQDQTIIFDSFPWIIKTYFKDAMKRTVQYTNELSNFDVQKIPLEQQICLLKVPDTVKEKAMQKLKELKAKSEDSGSKARQYLDGLLKIPFNIYKKESILNVMDNIRQKYITMLQVNNLNKHEIKDSYTSLEILQTIKEMKSKHNNNSINNLTETNEDLTKINEILKSCNRIELKNYINNINDTVKIKKLSYNKIKISNKSREEMISEIMSFINMFLNMSEMIHGIFNIKTGTNSKNDSEPKLLAYIKEIEENYGEINTYMTNVKTVMDSSVHGHSKAKKQIERIIGQWINGKQSGYCFGFEGPPGVGKCLAKDTPVMLSNGDIKLVQHITIHDKLMGDDSNIRNILALGSGREQMYKIIQSMGDEYIVNKSHILSLKYIDPYQIEPALILENFYYNNDIIDISIQDYVALPNHLQKNLYGYKVGLHFDKQHVDIEPYMLGYWIGNQDNLVNNTHVLLKSSIKEITSTLLNKYNLINNKHIPNKYKCNSQEIRLELLAGILDSSSVYNTSTNSYEIIQDSKELANDILWLVRSLGIRGTMNENNINNKYTIIISLEGSEKIHTLIEKTKVSSNDFCIESMNNNLHSSINVIPLDEDEYFGFQIDGNARFLLGDFTVTHNTSLAKKGLSECLKDENGVSRPFAMIQMGGDSNGSSLHGHNYTYVGSTWGSIVQILIDKKCMNPIIFIDEIDKISKTEHGKEIIGILTHLLDPAQNDCFQDKYFSGIDLDLSKALFILSYNDVESIDKILLDRIHRIQFKNLSLDEKLIICNSHILPEVYEKMGLKEMIQINDDVLKFIIEEYTLEPGVRKLKEILFEIVGEINLDILYHFDNNYTIPINITIHDIKTKYFKDKHEIIIRKVSNINEVGLINGMYATSLGNGGVLPIHAKYFPSNKFLDLKLTGLQQDVMRESMHVALTVSWNLTNIERQKELRKLYDIDNNICGINIHTGDNAVAKDGPSGGCAITCALYSLLNNIPIRPGFGITGEIQMSGEVTAIGGLNYKILGSIKSNVKSFIFPKENEKDFNEFYDKYKGTELLSDITFYPISNVKEAFELILDTSI